MTAVASTAATASAEELIILRAFDVAPLALAESRTLQQRIDRKYLLPSRHLESLLSLLHPDHLLLLAGDVAWARYETVYFDSADRDLYHAHRRGLMPRYKVRIRHHLDRQLTFLELKRKERSGRTVKWRRSLPFGRADLDADDRRFIEAYVPLDAHALVPAVALSFLRLTLLGRVDNERLTLDRQLALVVDGRPAPMPPAVIAEVKQPRFSNHTDAVSALRLAHAREMALSKYCLGTLMSAPVRGNVFKPTLHALERISA